MHWREAVACMPCAKHSHEVQKEGACSIWRERNKAPWDGMPSGLIAAAQGNIPEMVRSLEAHEIICTTEAFDMLMQGMMATLLACKSQPSQADVLLVICHVAAAGLKLHAPLHLYKGRTLLALASQHGSLNGIHMLTEGCCLAITQVGSQQA